MAGHNARVLILDIETAPNVVYTWGRYEQNAIDVVEDWYIMSFSAKWLGEKKVTTYALPDFQGYKRNMKNDKSLMVRIKSLLDEADFIVAHNGDNFDIRKINTRLLIHGMTPPIPYKSVDTKKLARKVFRFDSNKLDELGRQLGLGRKIDNGGFDLWKRCMAGEKAAWKEMKKYNEQDVYLLEKIYLTLRPWSTNHPNVGLIIDKPETCPICGEQHSLQSRGFRILKTGKRPSYQCNVCGGWSSGPVIKSEIKIS